MTDKKTYHIHVHQPETSVVQLLSNSSALPNAQIKRAMQNGAVWLKRSHTIKRLRRAKKPLLIGDEIFFYYSEAILSQQVMPADLIFDQGTWSVWFKPSGMFSQGSKWGDHCTLARYVERKLEPERPVFPIHRLDRATSGIMIVAHEKSIARQIAAQFETRQIKKYYQARVAGDFSSQLEAGECLIREPLDHKQAITKITGIMYDPIRNESLLDVDLMTGRKHQIRRHLSHRGFSIIGDRLYGRNGDEGIDLQLQAVRLSFTCPITGNKQSFSIKAANRL